MYSGEIFCHDAIFSASTPGWLKRLCDRGGDRGFDSCCGQANFSAFPVHVDTLRVASSKKTPRNKNS